MYLPKPSSAKINISWGLPGRTPACSSVSIDIANSRALVRPETYTRSLWGTSTLCQEHNKCYFETDICTKGHPCALPVSTPPRPAASLTCAVFAANSLQELFTFGLRPETDVHLFSRYFNTVSLSPSTQDQNQFKANIFGNSSRGLKSGSFKSKRVGVTPSCHIKIVTRFFLIMMYLSLGRKGVPYYSHHTTNIKLLHGSFLTAGNRIDYWLLKVTTTARSYCDD